MKLFTITATPIMNEAQAQEFPGYKGDIVKFNKSNLKDYKQQVAGILANWGIDGFTIYQVDGYWMGRSEASFKIEIAIDSDSEVVYTVARELRQMYNQDAVMLTLPDNTVKFIED